MDLNALRRSPFLWIGIIISGLFFLSCMKNTDNKSIFFVSSDYELNRSFDWAKKTALSYVREGDPVGVWYEASLPGREAFCMRDVSHQAMGAHVLGLQQHTLNMFRKIAENISESKDWCSYWEINRFNEPAPVDYRNDKEFWYNLTANFDVLDACYRMYQWSGDSTYIKDPVFLNFYEKTIEDYVERWDLCPDKLMGRERFMNRLDFDPEDKYQFCRGIPSYFEGDPGKTRVGVDLLAFQTAALRSFAKIRLLNGRLNSSRIYEERANKVEELILNNFWSNDESRFYDLLQTDNKFVNYGGKMRIYLLYTDAIRETEYNLKNLQNIINDPAINIEIRSHYPEVFFKYGANEEAYEYLLELTDPGTKGRDYPEVSFAVIGAIVNGLMGIQPSAENNSISTISRLTDYLGYAEIFSIPVLNYLIDVRHNGRYETILTNHSADSLRWIARYPGKTEVAFVNSEPHIANKCFDYSGQLMARVEIIVAPHSTAKVNFNKK